ncbi:Lrp/AsnC ligand binding domain-containing protein [Paraburkholderia sp. USG1]|uniref:hypothetical protein n=1 Tax=Paraburkholderia sp. USG1 TaxID=2952268 RepID=UPI00286548F5|nr:hypothetical protein [Paraburkholderia sp. USG1]MDR8402228.1 Lrp/AsnC ligand binding domain-containing protein [Paraburkholderia sp. USG1]
MTTASEKKQKCARTIRDGCRWMFEASTNLGPALIGGWLAYRHISSYKEVVTAVSVGLVAVFVALALYPGCLRRRPKNRRGGTCATESKSEEQHEPAAKSASALTEQPASERTLDAAPDTQGAAQTLSSGRVTTEQSTHEAKAEATNESGMPAKTPLSPSKQRELAAIEMQPTLDRVSWTLMAVVLLLNAIDGVNRVFQNDHGIPKITSEIYTLPTSYSPDFTRLDVWSLTLGFAMIIAPVFCSWYTPARGAGPDDRRYLRKAAIRHVVVLAVFASLGALLILSYAHVSPLHAPYQPEAPKIITSDELMWSASGLALFIFGYISDHGTSFELFKRAVAAMNGPSSSYDDRSDAAPRPKESHDRQEKRNEKVREFFTEDDNLIWLRILRRFFFESVVLPPIIGSAALVSGALDPASAVIYGLFVYSGFSVWNLAVKVVQGRKNVPVGIFAVVIQFINAFLVTILWATVFWKLREFVDHRELADFREPFKAVLGMALAAILVQVVFGPVYRNAWGKVLSDRWFLDGPEYVVFAVMVCVGLAAIPQSFPYKPCFVGGLLLLLILTPAMLVRRSLTAYVLIRVLPGKTEQVRKKLRAAELASAVVYGDFDLLVKVEVPGKLALPSAETDSRNLGLLAALVKKGIRSAEDGVRETQTLLDFSGFVHHSAEMEPSEPNGSD